MSSPCSSRDPFTRRPLSTLPLSTFLPQPIQLSPHKPLRASPPKQSTSRLVTAVGMPLLPSPFLADASSSRPGSPAMSRPTSRPGSPLRHLSSPSRGSLAMADDEVLEGTLNDAMPPTPPRRLIDAFMRSASPSKARSRSESPAPSSVSSRISLAGTPAKAEEEQKSTWSFFEDPTPALANPLPTPPLIESQDPLDQDEDDMPIDENEYTKENLRPALRPAVTIAESNTRRPLASFESLPGTSTPPAELSASNAEEQGYRSSLTESTSTAVPFAIFNDRPITPPSPPATEDEDSLMLPFEIESDSTGSQFGEGSRSMSSYDLTDVPDGEDVPALFFNPRRKRKSEVIADPVGETSKRSKLSPEA